MWDQGLICMPHVAMFGYGMGLGGEVTDIMTFLKISPKTVRLVINWIAINKWNQKFICRKITYKKISGQ